LRYVDNKREIIPQMIRRIVLVFLSLSGSGFVHEVIRSGIRKRSSLRVQGVEKEVLKDEAENTEALGVDVWGEPVTANDMMPVNAGENEELMYTAADFAGSEWKIGVLWRESEKIDVTWFRCKEDQNSEWGWGADGKWKVEDGIYFTVSRDFPLGWNGRRLFSAKIGRDPNYLEGIIRGWKPWEPASVMGSFQAIRLGVNRTNPPPWENRQDDDDDNMNEKMDGEVSLQGSTESLQTSSMEKEESTNI